MANDDQDEAEARASQVLIGRLRRDLGTLESYAALLGILIGAGIFTVTSRAWTLTGPSVILGYVILLPVVLATSVPYAAFLSTPLGREPGGEYTHISRTLGGYRIAFIGTWLKIISYIGALAFLATALADYMIQFAGGRLQPEMYRLPLALGSLLFFYLVHVVGVRWFGRLQVTMCALLGLSLIVLIVPGLFAVRVANYQPFITHGLAGLAASLTLLFFSYAGFESLAQTAGEVKDSTERLPRVFLKGMPSRLAIILARDGLAPRWSGTIHPRTGTPIRGLTLTLAAATLLLISGQVSLALNIAVFALVVLYFLHSLTFLLLPSRNPRLYSLVNISLSSSLQRAAALLSVLAMGGIIAIQVVQDLRTLVAQSFRQRLVGHSLTSVELALAWGLIGAMLYAYGRLRGHSGSVSLKGVR